MDIETASPLEIMCGYVNTVRSMKEEFKRWAEGEKRIDVVEISMKQVRADSSMADSSMAGAHNMPPN